MRKHLASRRSVLSGALAAGAAIATPNIARAAPSVLWRVQSHWPAASASFTDSLIITRDLLAERTDGRFKLQLYGSGELFKGAEIFNAVRRGVVEMGTILASYIENEVKSAGIVGGMPGTFQRIWEAAHFLKNIGAEKIFADELLKQGVMYMTEKSYASELVVKKPIDNLADFSALTIRSTGILANYLTEAGAKTIATPPGELYQALESGILDGAHWGAAQGAYSMKLYDFAKYHVRPPLSINADGFIFSKAAYDKLPKDLQQTLMATLEERYWRRTFDYEHKEELTLQKAMRELGVHLIQFPDDVKAKLKDAAKLVLDAERAKGGTAAEGMARMDLFLAELGYA
jgi:TRAP-type mannitol/chloroaromatic compound transport system substrate-binding protein